MIHFNKVKLQSSEAPVNHNGRESSVERDIAIIGISLQCAGAENPEQYWDLLRSASDCIGEFPSGRRRDTDLMLQSLGFSSEAAYGEAAYLDEIDKFDYRLFKLSPKEASLMDPNQRLFLESAWAVLEDAGYGGNALSGSKTGIYVGYGADSDYRRMIAATDEDLLPSSLAGNVRPILASRLSYIMDFHGPSMIVDTTCSSSLMAIHLACQAIRSGECEMAIAGGIQLHLLPIRQGNIGIESSDGRAKTFDNRSDGTGTGEGVFTILLKPLRRAQRDGDSIYAVVKGSAANHDGASIGITAPNALAQEEVIVKAWQDSGINPESIGFIEAHGTGTKLGDPIEIDGITRAFRRFTDHIGFCAVGSVKTNIGHLDHAAGIAGLVKAVLALHHQQLPPTLHFQQPNQKINFEESPIYVNDRLQSWDCSNGPRRCGVSSFGLSGTNCHIVLEEAPSASNEADRFEKDAHSGPFIFTVSAVTQSSLTRLLTRYSKWLKQDPASSLGDICYTAATGRGHYTYRIAIVVHSIAELNEKLALLNSRGLFNDPALGIYYGEHKIVAEAKKTGSFVEWTEVELKQCSLRAAEEMKTLIRTNSSEQAVQICKLYAQGADIDWMRLYRPLDVQRVHLPTYAFDRNRCWLESRVDKPHSMLIDRCIASSIHTDLYSTEFNAERQWVLSEHKIAGESVLVGTAYIEMVLEACNKFWMQHMSARIQDLLFMNPLTVKAGETYEVQLTLHREAKRISFDIAGRLLSAPGMTPGVTLEETSAWSKLAEGSIVFQQGVAKERLAIQKMIDGLKGEHIEPDLDHYNRTTIFEFGPRWRNISDIYVGERELISRIELPDAYKSEASSFMIHPSLMDNALATAPLLNKALSHLNPEDRVYLPFSYKRIELYRQFPAIVYSHVQLKHKIEDHAEIIAFDIAIVDEQGQRLAQIEDYMLKKATKLNYYDGKIDNQLLYGVDWAEQPWVEPTIKDRVNLRHLSNAQVLLVHSDNEYSDRMLKYLKDQGVQVTEAIPGNQFVQLSESKYTFNHQVDNYVRLIDEAKIGTNCIIIHMLTCAAPNSSSTMNELERGVDQGVYSLLFMTQALLHHRIHKAQIILVTSNSYKITGKEGVIQPENAAMIALGNVIRKEYQEISCHAIDIGDSFDTQWMNELLGGHAPSDLIAYRNGKKFRAQFTPRRQDDYPEHSDRSEITLKSDGVYVITGGAGGIGAELAAHLMKKTPMKIALIGRRSDEDPNIIEQMKQLLRIKGAASEVRYYPSDVSNMNELSEALTNIRQHFGSITGVIHCAGIAGDGFLIRKQVSEFRNVLLPKVHGAWLLDHLTLQDSLDFMIVCSSNTTLMGVAGQGDYAAANAYLDSFAGWRNRAGRRTMTISWPAWKETGLAYEYGTNMDNIFRAISTQQALIAFDEALKLGEERIIVGELLVDGTVNGYSITDADIGLSSEITSWLNKGTNSESNSRKPVPISNNTGSGDTKLEAELEEIWKEVLGYEQIHADDNFFEIGGDSILVTRMQSLINKKYPDAITVADLFTYSTIQDIAQYLKGKWGAAEGSRSVTEVFGDGQHEDEAFDYIEDLVHQIESGTVSIGEAVQIYMRANSSDDYYSILEGG